MACGFKVFLEIHGIHRQHVHFPHRKGFSFAQGDAQQRTRHHDMVVRCFLAKIFQAVESSCHLLYFIKDDKRVAWCDLDPRDGLEGDEDALNVIIEFEELLHLRFVVTIDVSHFFVLLFSEVLHDPSLSHLSCSEQHQRFPVRA